MNIVELLKLELKENCLDYHGILHFNVSNKIINISGGNIKTIPKNVNLVILLTENLSIYNNDFLIYHYPIMDFSVPEKESFKNFIIGINEVLKEKGVKNLHVACGQGHGRTGIFLVILSMELLNISVQEAIIFVKNNYCRNIIETEEQLNFLLNY